MAARAASSVLAAGVAPRRAGATNSGRRSDGEARSSNGGRGRRVPPWLRELAASNNGGSGAQVTGPRASGPDGSRLQTLPAATRLAVAERQLVDMFLPGRAPPKSSEVATLRAEIERLTAEVHGRSVLRPAAAAAAATTPRSGGGDPPRPQLDALMAELARLKAENEKLKLLNEAAAENEALKSMLAATGAELPVLAAPDSPSAQQLSSRGPVGVGRGAEVSDPAVNAVDYATRNAEAAVAAQAAAAREAAAAEAEVARVRAVEEAQAAVAAAAVEKARADAERAERAAAAARAQAEADAKARAEAEAAAAARAAAADAVAARTAAEAEQAEAARRERLQQQKKELAALQKQRDELLRSLQARNAAQAAAPAAPAVPAADAAAAVALAAKAQAAAAAEADSRREATARALAEAEAAEKNSAALRARALADLEAARANAVRAQAEEAAAARARLEAERASAAQAAAAAAARAEEAAAERAKAAAEMRAKAEAAAKAKAAAALKATIEAEARAQTEAEERAKAAEAQKKLQEEEQARARAAAEEAAAAAAAEATRAAGAAQHAAVDAAAQRARGAAAATLAGADLAALASAHPDALYFTVPEKLVAGAKAKLLVQKAKSAALAPRPAVTVVGGFNGWRRARFTSAAAAVPGLGGAWGAIDLEIPAQARSLAFVLSDGGNMWDNNGARDFVLPVEFGPSEDELVVIERAEAEAQRQADAAAAEAEAAARAEAAELAAEAADGDRAQREVDGQLGAIRAIVAAGQVGVEGLWRTEPAPLMPGTQGTLYFNVDRRPLSGKPKIVLSSGFNQWGHASKAQAVMAPAPGLAPGWMMAPIEVPADAATLDFVLSDGGGLYDNNNRADFHAPLAGAAGRLDSLRVELVQSRIEAGRAARRAKGMEEALRAQRRAKARAEAMAESLRILRLQLGRVLSLEPAAPVAGEVVRVFYNPDNTCLHGRREVFITGGWNRWGHPERFGPLKMAPPDAAGPHPTHHSATIPVPRGAWGMEFVFSDGTHNGSAYDNRGGFDYHVEVSGARDMGAPVAAPPLHVVHISVEMAPIAKVGGLGDVVTALARAVKEKGHRVEVIVPKFDCLNYGAVHHMKEVGEVNYFGAHNKVYHGLVEGLDTFFIDPTNNDFFRRGCVYSDGNRDPERFGYFSKIALEWLAKSGRRPNILHCHDWPSAPVAKFYWDDYSHGLIPGAKVVFTIHNLGYGAGLISQAMSYCQKATTVSPSYASEIAGQPSVAHSVGKMRGIINGIDTEIWDPSNDPFLPRPFTYEDHVEGKLACKRALQQRFGLQQRDAPMVGVVTRLTQQKGIHLIKHAIAKAIERGCQVVLLGSAPDQKVQKDFEIFANDIRNRNWGQVYLHFSFDEPLSHHIYAASDMLLVPSMFEPCGLSQLIAMRYGAIPVVRRTGGLNDSVFDVDTDKGRAEWQGLEPNGFNFEGTDAGAMDYALNRTVDAFWNDRAWFQGLQTRVMKQDWSWNRPGLEYIELYYAALKQ